MASLLQRLFLPCLVWVIVASPTLAEERCSAQKTSGAQIPLDQLPKDLRGKVAEVLKQPSLQTNGPVEAFPCRAAVYAWLLDHPHWVMRAWHAAGAKCANIERQADGSFAGMDQSGSELRWRVVVNEPGRRVWYAEGSGRPLPLVPAVSLRALVTLRYEEVTGPDGRVGIRQRSEVIAIFDGKAANLAAKIWGMSTEHAARQALEQINLFFAGMAWYLSEHPKWAMTAFNPNGKLKGEELREVEPLLRELRAAAQPK